jgi:phosphate transport system permease protein
MADRVKLLKPSAKGRGTHCVLAAMALLAALLLLSVVIPLVVQALPVLRLNFIFGRPSELGGGGVAPEIVNTLVMVAASQIISFPLAVMAAIYRVEFAVPSWWTSVMDQFSETMLSVPSMVIGLVVVDMLIGRWHWPVSVMTGIVALALMNWPFTLVMVTQSLQDIPKIYREGSWALGGSRWQTVWRMVLPQAMPAMIEQGGLATARLMGETAVLLYTAGINVGRHFRFTGPGETLAVHLWAVRTEGVMPQATAESAATGVVLLVLVALVLWGSRKVAQWLGRI